MITIMLDFSSDVTIVIPYYSGKQSLDILLKQLNLFNVLIINNSHNTLETKIGRKNITIINMPYNTGFAHACNVGILASTSKWILFLNPDINISSTTINNLLNEAKDRLLQAISPQLINSSGEISWQYHQTLPDLTSLFTQFSPLHRIYKTKINLAKNSSTTLPGACLLITRKALLQANYWDERFFVWWEDSDLSVKLKNTGIAFGVSKYSKVTHVGGESFSSLSQEWKINTFFHSLLIYIDKHFFGLSKLFSKILIHRFNNNKLYLPDHKIELSIVIPNLKPKLLETFLEKNFTYLDKKTIEVIVVSSAKSIQHLRKKYSSIIFITLQQNAGFAKTVNIGLRRAKGNRIGTINDDVILHKNWEVSLLNAFKTKTGSVVPQVINDSGQTESIGIYVEKKGKALVVLKAEKDKFKVNAFNAACVIFSREALEHVGLFYEPFESYLEDLDLGLRMTDAGFNHLSVPEVSVIHLGQQTSGNNKAYKAWLDTKNWWLLLLRNHSLLDWVIYFPFILVERAKNISGLIKTKLKTHN